MAKSETRQDRKRRKKQEDDKGEANVKSQVPARRVRKSSRLVRIGLRIAALIFPFAALAAINVVLYWSDFGVDTSLVVSAPKAGSSLYYLNPAADYAYFSSDLRGPEPRAFTLPKPAGTYRIAVVGASSVQGYPYSSELSFPRHLELILARQLERLTPEVLNVGIVGLSTKPLVDIVEQVFAVQPDAIVFYEGHNEFYGVGGVATNASISSFGISIRHYRLGQFFSKAIWGEPKISQELLATLPKDTEIPFDSPLISLAELQYEASLTQICDLCATARIPIVLCSVVSNLRNQSPLPSQSSNPGIARDVKALEQSARDAMSRKEASLASQFLRKAIELDPTNAVLHYRLAQCLDQSGEREDAAAHFALARDFDFCRYRAPGSFREIIQRVANRNADRGALLVDLVPIFASAAENSAPGDDLFLEHVHFNIEGHWLVAQSLAKSIVGDLCRQKWNEDNLPSAADRDQWLGLRPEDQIVAHTLAYYVSKTPPFDRAVDGELHRVALSGRLEKYAAMLSDHEIGLFSQIDRKSRIDDLIDALGRACLARNQLEEALKMFELGQRRRPWFPNSLVFSAICLHQLHRDQEAAEALRNSQKTSLPATPPVVKLRNDLWKRLRLSDPAVK